MKTQLERPIPNAVSGRSCDAHPPTKPLVAHTEGAGLSPPRPGWGPEGGRPRAVVPSRVHLCAASCKAGSATICSSYHLRPRCMIGDLDPDPLACTLKATLYVVALVLEMKAIVGCGKDPHPQANSLGWGAVCIAQQHRRPSHGLGSWSRREGG